MDHGLALCCICLFVGNKETWTQQNHNTLHSVFLKAWDGNIVYLILIHKTFKPIFYPGQVCFIILTFKIRKLRP